MTTEKNVWRMKRREWGSKQKNKGSGRGKELITKIKRRDKEEKMTERKAQEQE